MFPPTRFFLLGILVLVVSFTGIPVSAQMDGTGITGTVTDPTGRVIPEVQVVAAQDATGLRRETETVTQMWWT